MNLYFRLTLMLALVLASTGYLKAAADSCHLELKITGIKQYTGKILIAAFNNANQFPSGESSYKYAIPINNTIHLTLPIGQFAFALFQDLNGNMVLDKNFFGIPKEPFGFSNNPRITTGAPSFETSAVQLTKGKKTVEIKLIRFL